MKRSRKHAPTNPPIAPFQPLVKRIYVPSIDSDCPALLRDELAWVVFVTSTTALDYGYWILVAASSAMWSRGSRAMNDALLALVADMTRELGYALYVLEGPVDRVVYAEPSWIWVLRDPQDRFHLMSANQKLRTVDWSAMPALNPEISAGSRESLCWLFPTESQQGLAALSKPPMDFPNHHPPSTMPPAFPGKTLPPRLPRFTPPAPKP